MVNSYDDMQGSVLDKADHPANSEDDYKSRRAGETQLAGDVIPMAGYMSKNRSSDDTTGPLQIMQSDGSNTSSPVSAPTKKKGGDNLYILKSSDFDRKR